MSLQWRYNEQGSFSPHKGSVTWKMFPFDDVIMFMGYVMQSLENQTNRSFFDSQDFSFPWTLVHREKNPQYYVAGDISFA